MHRKIRAVPKLSLEQTNTPKQVGDTQLSHVQTRMGLIMSDKYIEHHRAGLLVKGRDGRLVMPSKKTNQNSQSKKKNKAGRKIDHDATNLAVIIGGTINAAINP